MPKRTLNLTITNEEMVEFFDKLKSDAERERIGLIALSIGVKAMKNAAGEVDRKSIKEEFDGLVEKLGARLVAHSAEAFSYAPDAPIGKLLGQIEGKLGAHGKVVAEDMRAQLALSQRELSLDLPGSGLSRLLRSVQDELRPALEKQDGFLVDLRQSLAVFQARAEAEARGTAHGMEFAAALGAKLVGLGIAADAVITSCGETPGKIPRCKTGDFIIDMGPEHIAYGERIVIEAKQSGGYSGKKVWEELEQAKQNREASVGVFVMSERHHDMTMQSLERKGDSVYCMWSAEEPETDVNLRAAMLLAVHMVMKKKDGGKSKKGGKEIEAIDAALVRVQQQLKWFDEMVVQTNTISGHSEKLRDRMVMMKAEIGKQLRRVEEEMGGLR